MNTSRRPKPTGLDHLGNLPARGLLGVRRDRIFEVENDAVSGSVFAFSSARALEPGM